MTEAVERMLPLYEAKMIHHYDHRWATYEVDGSTRNVTLAEKQHPEFAVMPRYWVRAEVVADRLGGDENSQPLGWRRIARATDERTMIAARLESAGYGDSVFIMIPSSDAGLIDCLQANLSSFVFDFAFRQKMGGTNASFFLVEQLPALSPERFTGLQTWMSARVQFLSADWSEKRSRIRAELDAVMFHLYGIERDDVDYIMETFPIVKRKDVAEHGEYRTKRLILEVYDQMADAQRAGTTYHSPLDEDLRP